MRYSLVRTINLGNISPLYQNETEEIGVHDADSFEEAAKTADKLTAERIGYHKASAEQNKKVAPSTTQVGPGHMTPAPVPPAAPIPSTPPIAPAPTPTGISSQPPSDLA